MSRFLSASLAAPLLLAGCHAASVRRSVDVIIDMDEATHVATLTCRGSSSGKCGVVYIGMSGDALEAQAEVGAKVVTGGIALPARYCVASELPDPAHCDAKPLSAGEQIVRKRETRGD